MMQAPKPPIRGEADQGKLQRYLKSVGAGSLFVSLGIHLGLLALFGVVVLTIIPPDPKPEIEFAPGNRGGGSGSPTSNASSKKIHQRAPLAPAMSRVSALDAVSSIQLPDLDLGSSTLSPLPSLGGFEGSGLGSGSGRGFGSGAGNGSGIGIGNKGLSDSTLAGKASFFEQKVSADRVVFVIDYSGSMNGERSKLMRSELSKSVSALSPLMKFQLIFFAGPTWIAGDQVKMIKINDSDKSPRRAEVTTSKRTYQWENVGKGVWEPDRRIPTPPWRMVDADSIHNAVDQIKSTPFQYGGYWVAPLELALAMDPPPDQIFFMTDGASSDNTRDAMRDVIRHAKSRKTKINTIAMMEPEAEEGMKALAHATGGMFTIVERGGKVTVVNPE
ncbi:VWA domain-containing protein [Luteolibacter pohnpeiensis]|uniref:VWA domain-containing protein n=1 Tax=Luteolibacter pohnpeiensis TaxID=454153 RepID=A0A934VW73_9BACT|nr:vWA domain-containing protein [Luteolibacter pohnpeiensis]MBK1882199.1 VWA domain-containing protein [Luteolibacter pohnpeiensis]